MNKKLVLIAASLALFSSGCSRREFTEPLEEVQVSSNSQGRVVVERVGVVADPLAYNGMRGVYVIRDTKTGQEFIGVSGVGISEAGSHQSGKTQTTDER